MEYRTPPLEMYANELFIVFQLWKTSRTDCIKPNCGRLSTIISNNDNNNNETSMYVDTKALKRDTYKHTHWTQ